MKNKKIVLIVSILVILLSTATISGYYLYNSELFFYSKVAEKNDQSHSDNAQSDSQPSSEHYEMTDDKALEFVDEYFTKVIEKDFDYLESNTDELLYKDSSSKYTLISYTIHENNTYFEDNKVCDVSKCIVRFDHEWKVADGVIVTDTSFMNIVLSDSENKYIVESFLRSGFNNRGNELNFFDTLEDIDSKTSKVESGKYTYNSDNFYVDILEGWKIRVTSNSGVDSLTVHNMNYSWSITRNPVYTGGGYGYNYEGVGEDCSDSSLINTGDKNISFLGSEVERSSEFFILEEGSSNCYWNGSMILLEQEDGDTYAVNYNTFTNGNNFYEDPEKYAVPSDNEKLNDWLLIMDDITESVEVF